MDFQEPVITVAQAAAALGISETSIRRMIGSGKMRAVKISTHTGQEWRIVDEDVRALAADRLPPAPASPADRLTPGQTRPAARSDSSPDAVLERDSEDLPPAPGRPGGRLPPDLAAGPLLPAASLPPAPAPPAASSNSREKADGALVCELSLAEKEPPGGRLPPDLAAGPPLPAARLPPDLAAGIPERWGGIENRLSRIEGAVAGQWVSEWSEHLRKLVEAQELLRQEAQQREERSLQQLQALREEARQREEHHHQELAAIQEAAQKREEALLSQLKGIQETLSRPWWKRLWPWGKAHR